MAAERRSGFALFSVIMMVLVFAVAATIMVTTLSGNNDQYRIENAADVLHRIAAEIDTGRSGTLFPQSFIGQVALYPGKLSHLYTKIVQTTDKACSGTAYTATNVGNWHGPYHLSQIPATGSVTIAPGFVANDLILKNSTSQLSIQLPGSSLADAQALELFVDRNGKSDGSGPVVVFSSTNPTTINYRISNLLSGGC